MDISGNFFCSRCMRQIEEEGICPYCGYDHREEENKNPALARGTLLHDRYQLGSVIGIGGFGITYAAYDEILQAPVAIKEYFPRDLVSRNTEYSDDLEVSEEKSGLYRIGREHFIREARVLGMMKNMRGVVSVQDYFEENETAYIVMEFIRGITLGEYVRQEKIKPDELFEMIRDVIDSLIILHRQGILHRDITPSNLMVQENGSVKLIDFGSASRMDCDQTMIMVTNRYAPLEQYGTSHQAQGPWTDIYSLCATLYDVLTGEPPQDALKRAQKDELVSLNKKKLHLKSYQSRAIMSGLALDPKKRPQSMEEFRSILYNVPMPEEIRLRRKIMKEYAGVLAGIVLVGLGGYWALNSSWIPSNTLMDVSETDFAEHSWYNSTGSGVSVFGNEEYNRNEIASITILDSKKEAPKDAWDVSDTQDGSVLAWVEASGSLYDLYIGAEGGVKANENSKYAFACFESAEKITFGDNFDTSEAVYMGGLFQDCMNLTDLDVSGFDTSQVTDMSDMFEDCRQLEVLDVSGFDTAQATDMSGMFSGCYKVQALELEGFQTSETEDMSTMFHGCRSLTELNADSFDTSKVTNMRGMFWRCESLTDLNLSGFDTSKVTNMANMFSGCEAMATLDIGSFDTAKVTDMGSMFEGCTSLKAVDLSGFVTSAVTDMAYMFEECVQLESLAVNHLDTSKAEDMSSLFAGCQNLSELDLSGLKTFSAKDMSSMFKGCISLRKINLTGIETENVERMYSMFADCASLTELDVSGFDTSNVTTMSSMFSGCEMLETLDIRGFHTAKLENMAYMFEGCASLTKLDLSEMDTSGVEDMHGLFKDCKRLRELNLDGLDTSKAESFSYMFDGCQSLTELELTFDTSQVIEMDYMFRDCSGLVRLSLHGFSNPKTEEMGSMFSDCSSLTELDLSEFGTSQAEDMSWMFYGCVSLEKLDVSGFDTANVGDMRYMFYDCASLSDIDLSGFDTSSMYYEEGMLGGTIWEGKEIPEVKPLKNTLMSAESTDFDGFDWQDGSGRDAGVFGNTSLNRAQIGSITFLNHLTDVGSNAWDVSASQDGSVLAWTEKKGELYDLYIAAEGSVKANENSKAAFAYFENTKEIHFNGCFDTSGAANMNIMFDYCRKLEQMDVSGFETADVWNMRGMFEGCESLEILSLEGFQTEKVTDMAYMFYDCYALKEADVFSFNTEKVTDMSAMFYNCMELEELNVSNFNTEKVENMSWMFYNCCSVKALDVSGFNTSKATAMRSMFYGCSQVEELDVTGFFTGRVTDMAYMFYGCVNLKKLDVSNFTTWNVKDMRYMFYNCMGLTELDVSGFDMEQALTENMFTGTVLG